MGGHLLGAQLWGPRAGMARRMCASMKFRSVYSSEESLPDIGAKVTARYRSKGYNGSNSHPKAGLSWPMAYPYSPMLPSVLAVVNVEGAQTGTTTDPLRIHPTPTALPRSYIAVISSPLILNTTGYVHTPPLKCPPSRKT